MHPRSTPGSRVQRHLSLVVPASNQLRIHPSGATQLGDTHPGVEDTAVDALVIPLQPRHPVIDDDADDLTIESGEPT